MALKTLSGAMINQAILASKMIGAVKEMILVGLVAGERHLATSNCLGGAGGLRRHGETASRRRHAGRDGCVLLQKCCLLRRDPKIQSREQVVQSFKSG